MFDKIIPSPWFSERRLIAIMVAMAFIAFVVAWSAVSRQSAWRGGRRAKPVQHPAGIYERCCAATHQKFCVPGRRPVLVRMAAVGLRAAGTLHNFAADRSFLVHSHGFIAMILESTMDTPGHRITAALPHHAGMRDRQRLHQAGILVHEPFASHVSDHPALYPPVKWSSGKMKVATLSDWRLPEFSCSRFIALWLPLPGRTPPN